MKPAVFLNVETEQYYVAVLYYVILAFRANLAFFPCAVVSAAFEQRLPFSNLSAYKTAFEVGMNFSRCLRSFRSLYYSPGARFLFACGQVRNQP